MAKRSKKKKANVALPRKMEATSAGAPSRDWIWGLLLAAMVVAVYLPVWQAGYIWDDDTVVTRNVCIIGPLGLKEIWTSNAADICPMTLTTFWLEHALWGLAPLPYHLVNVAQHAAGAVVLWRVLRGLQIPGAWIGAALWALHPVQVESVAWITEMKNTESALFYLLSLLFFVRNLKNRTTWNYVFTLLFAALAMTSKSSTVVLPLVMILCAWWMERRWPSRRLMQTVPMFFMALAAGLASIWTQKAGGADDAQWAQSGAQRVATSGDVVWFYLGKLFWPHPLITIYPRWQIDAAAWTSYLPLLAVAMVSVILWRGRGTWARPWFFAWLYFLVALGPVMGFANMVFTANSQVADHFQYLASMGPLALIGAGVVHLGEGTAWRKPWMIPTLGAAVLLILGLLSCRRAVVFQNEDNLWGDTLAKNPECWVGYNNFGIELSQKGRNDEAIALFRKALELNPRYGVGYNNLGRLLAGRGEVDAAMDDYQKALVLAPTLPRLHANMADVLVQKGRLDEAVIEYQKALALDPNLADAHHDLGNIFTQKGRFDEAAAQYRSALALDPGDAAAYNNLGNILSQNGQVDEARVQFEKALELNPNLAEVHYNLGRAYVAEGRTDDAIAQFEEALRLQPNLKAAQEDLAKARASSPK